eukprot:1158941-Pelagomonas_calceolata.AAC.1
MHPQAEQGDAIFASASLLEAAASSRITRPLKRWSTMLQANKLQLAASTFSNPGDFSQVGIFQVAPYSEQGAGSWPGGRGSAAMEESSRDGVAAGAGVRKGVVCALRRLPASWPRIAVRRHFSGR